jgi:gliding motility-associated lipoprotein GldH
MKKTCLFAALILLGYSCSRQSVFEQFVTLPNQSWNNSEILHFNVNITDTVSAHNVYIAVRNTGQYEYSNLYLFVTARSPNGNQTRDTTEIILANEHGKWQGKGSASMFTLHYPFRQNIRFPMRGIYQFDIEQAMWIKDLKHVSDIGLRIEKAEERR